MPRDWAEWHRAYDDTSSHLSQRLRTVQSYIAEWLDGAAPGPLRAISICSGEGRDLVPVLVSHARGCDVRARLVELDPRNAAIARRDAPPTVEVVEADASTTDAYVGAVPADLLLVCGVFGNVSDGDVGRTVTLLPALCAPGATVVWTRHRRAPDLTAAIRGWFATAGFDEVAFDAPPDTYFGVGVHRLAVAPAPFEPGVRLFTFVGH
jgi:hypothetical protein